MTIEVLKAQSENEDIDSSFVIPDACECDSTHDSNNTVCRWCYSKGRRVPTDPDVIDAVPANLSCVAN